MTTGLPRASSARVRQELRAIWRRHRGRFVGVVLLNGAAAAFSLVPPRLVGLLIDRLGAGAGIGEVALYGAGMLAGVIAQSLFVLTAARSAWTLGEDVFAQLRLAFLSEALLVPMGVIEEAGTGELVTRTTQDINAVGETVRWALPGSLVSALTVGLTLIAAVAAAPLIAPVYLLALPVLVVLMRWYMRRAPDVYRHLGDSYGPTFASLDETASGARAVEALSLQEARHRSLTTALSAHWSAAVGRIRLRQTMLPWANLAFAIPVFSSLAWGGWLAVHGQVSVGTVVTVTLYAAALVAPLESLIDWTDELQRSAVSFARILGVGEAVEHGTAAAAEPSSTAVEMTAASFAYRAGREVLHGVSLQVVSGERLAIVGPSGAGKSTLARLLAGIDRPSAGRVTVGGVDASAIPLARRRGHVLLVAQESHVFAATVRENVLLGRLDALDPEVADALGRIGALEWIDALDDGWDTVVGSGGHPLTGAQEQQLALARVLLADPHTIILDEATSAMDPTAARDLEAALAATMQGRTVIAIAHRLSTAYDADRIAVVDGGRIVELGSHDELVEAGGAYARLWALWRDDGARSDGR
ncbi:ABC transporter ATP-binding protein [Microbacterium sp. MYb64]|uniref:ABC transporter ATP-binding protein n=1 Tax=Microbacterium sp. MYb64 TaxID=1848691 RepID=UPI000CFE3588|nr:ABC transporter ATP-binding protein [Microbacterium sp. MYb64]PRB05056.1 multidrug ABC transporter ATP-binding protein [Microbacterium sp. MYb64]